MKKTKSIFCILLFSMMAIYIPAIKAAPPTFSKNNIVLSHKKEARRATVDIGIVSTNDHYLSDYHVTGHMPASDMELIQTKSIARYMAKNYTAYTATKVPLLNNYKEKPIPGFNTSLFAEYTAGNYNVMTSPPLKNIYLNNTICNARFYKKFQLPKDKKILHGRLRFENTRTHTIKINAAAAAMICPYDPGLNFLA